MLQNKVRTTVYLPQNLIEAAKLEALSRGITLTGLVQEGLKKEIRIDAAKGKRPVMKFYKLGNPDYVFRREDAYE